MNDSLLALFDEELRRDLIVPDMRKDILEWGVRFFRPAPGLSRISYYNLSEETIDLAIREQILYFQDLNQKFSWKVYDHDTPAIIKEHLVAHGFEADDPGEVMLLDLAEIPVKFHENTHADLRPINTREQLGDIIEVLEAVWGGSFAWVTDRMGAHLEIDGYLSAWGAYVDDRPASVGWTYYPPGSQFASMFGGSTLPDQRKKGLYTATLARRAQEASLRGRRYLMVETGPESQPIVAKRGFIQLTTAQDFEWNPS